MSLYRFFAKASKLSDLSDPSGPLSASKEASDASVTVYRTKCERYQLRMRAISRSKHTKFKNTKIYSNGVLVNHTKISTNENFPLYGIRMTTFAEKLETIFNHSVKGAE